MTAHLTVLLEAAQRTKGTEDAPYVWWGKVRSPNRQQELRNLPQVLEIARDLERDEDGECHLYLTDYRSLYVGLVDAITSEDVRRTDGVHVPTYYTANSLECDFWYRLLDIRRLVGDDTPVVIEKLKALRNLNYGERPVSIYGGMVDLPLVVYRQDGPVVSNLAKALEVTCNAILRRVAQLLPREVRLVRVDQETIDLGAGKHLSTGQLAKVLRAKSPLHRQLRQRLENGDWFVDEFPKILGQVADVRNPGVHRVLVGRETAMRLRSALVGVGCQGSFVELAKVQPR